MATDKFTIIKGVDNEYTFTVKANNSLLPMPIATGTNTVVATTITEYPAADYIPPVTGTDAQLWKTRVYTDVTSLYNKPAYFGATVLPLDTEYSSTITIDLNLNTYRGVVRNDTAGVNSYGVKLDGIVYDITATTTTVAPITTTYSWGAARTLRVTVDGVTTTGVTIDLDSSDDELLTAVKNQLSLGSNYLVNIHDSKIYISKKTSAGGVLSVTGSNELAISKAVYPGVLGIHFITANHLWVNGSVTREWNGTSWVVPVVSVVVNGTTRSVNFDYTAHSNKNTLLQALRTQIATDISLVLVVEDDYIEISRSSDFTVVEGQYTRSRVTQVGIAAVSGNSGGYRIRNSSLTIDLSVLNRMTIPVNTVTLTSSAGTVVASVSRVNGVFPTTTTVTGLDTGSYHSLPPQVVITCSYQYSSTDTFTFTLRALTDLNTVVDSWTLGSGVSVVDSVNGRIKLVIAAAETTSLVSLKGAAEHGYYLRPVYELRLEADTQYNGNFVAVVGKVYVR
jgi:hypothetical protein